MFTLWVDEECEGEEASEYKAVQLAKVIAARCGKPCIVIEEVGDDHPGMDRWSVDPDGTEHALYMGSVQIV